MVVCQVKKSLNGDMIKLVLTAMFGDSPLYLPCSLNSNHFMFVEVFGFYYAWHTDVAFDVALNHLWDDETQIIWACIVSFWFGGQAFKK